ncbi:MAG: hypothetical protein MI924_17180 [Chloroflexales bacterium]|nr:hypothetical protein [Chloroflexales bacterium]
MKHVSFHHAARNILLVIFGTMVIFIAVAAIVSILMRRHTDSTYAAVAQATDPSITALSVTPLKEGDLIQDIAIDAFNPPHQPPNLSLRFTNATPLITQQEAMQVVRDLGVVWGLGGDFQGKPVTIRALYGQLTLGQPGDTSGLHTGDNRQLSAECVGWVGPCNVPINRCIEGNCQDTGRVITRIENRLYWIIDYGNTIMYQGGCPMCPEQEPYNHTVYAVDAQEKFVLMVWGYTAPSSQ